MSEKQKEGKFGEKLATRYLETMGYKILCNNFSCRQGEIDIIAKCKKEIVFIEVMTRSSVRYGEGKDAVDKNKQKHILGAAMYYLYKTKQESAFVRIDVIEVYIGNGKITLNHLKHVI